MGSAEARMGGLNNGKRLPSFHKLVRGKPTQSRCFCARVIRIPEVI